MDKLSGDNITALVTGLVGAGVVALGAYWQHRKGGGGEEAAAPRRKAPLEVALAEEDRDWISRLVRRMEEALGDHGKTVKGHANAIGEQTQALSAPKKTGRRG